MSDNIVDPNDNAFLKEAVKAFSNLSPEEQEKIILLLRFLSLPEES